MEYDIVVVVVVVFFFFFFFDFAGCGFWAIWVCDMICSEGNEENLEKIQGQNGKKEKRVALEIFSDFALVILNT